MTQFVNPGAHDWHLKFGAPAIGAADPADAPSTDRDGLARDAAPDAGAYEYGGGTPAPSPSPTPTPTPTSSPDTQAPSVPQGMAFTRATSSTIGLAWNPSSDNIGVAKYRIYRNGVLFATTSASATSYTLTGLACGASYKVGLTAVDAAGNESNVAYATGTTSTTACDAQAPSVPQGMAWTTITAYSIGVRWNASTDNVGVTGYRIYRNGVRIAQFGSGTTSYSLTGLACNTAYTVGLTAIDAAGNESDVRAATGTTRTTAC
jgi:chitin-binding protein